MRSITFSVLCAGGVLLLGGAAAEANTMHPELGAELSGMGEQGIVNLQSNATKGQLCWTFDVSAKGLTGASVRDSAGMVVAKLSATYKAKSCAAVPSKALALIESRPGSYTVWLDTRGHPGELRGKLHAGMAHM